MGQRRTLSQPQPQQPQSNAAVAAAIAALLLAPQPATVPAVAAELLSVLPFWLLRLPELAADVAEEAAKVTLTGPPTFDFGAGEMERRASLENILVRAFYGIAAARRLTEAVRGPSDTPRLGKGSRRLSEQRGAT